MTRVMKMSMPLAVPCWSVTDGMTAVVAVDNTRSRSPQVATVHAVETEPQRALHSFLGNQLLGAAPLTGDTPEPDYTIDGVRYAVESYLAIIEEDGTPRFDAQVRRP